MYISFIQNTALILALSALHGMLTRFREERTIEIKIFSGLLFGIIAIIGMMIPIHYAPGIIYDGRSIILAMAGLFGGGIASAISVVVAGAYRAQLGGAGVWAGLTTIIGSAMVGLAFRRAYGNHPEKLSILSLWCWHQCSHCYAGMPAVDTALAHRVCYYQPGLVTGYADFPPGHYVCGAPSQG